MAINLQRLQRDVQQEKLDPVYLIQGDDQYLLDQVRHLFTSLISDEDKTLNFAQFDMRETPLGLAVDDARSVPFFGDRRVVLIDNAYFLTGMVVKSKMDHNIEDLIAYLQQPEIQTVLVIFAPYEKLDSRKKITKLLKEQATYLPFGELTEKDIHHMIKERLDAAGYQITPGGLSLLIRLTHLSLTQIMSELDKLILYTYDEKVIDEHAVDDLVTRTLGENIFDLIDALLKQKLQQVVKLYHNLITSGEEPLRLHGALIKQFRLLLQVKAMQGTSEKGTASALKEHPYRVKLARQTVRRFSYKDLAEAYMGLIKMEEQLKFTSRDPELLFELFVLQYQLTTK